MAIDCDVLVVGAGPAGCAAARAAAMGGAKTILIDKREEVGKPVFCGEGISSYLLKYMPFKIPKNQLIWEASGISFWINGHEVEKKGSDWSGFTINREKYDKWLAKKAINAGVQLLTSAELSSLDSDATGNVTRAEVIHKTKRISIKPKILVGADGVYSKVLKLLGRYTPSKGNVAEVYSWELRKMSLKNNKFHQVYVGEFIPGGYGYILPKSKTSANVGIGSIIPKKSLKQYFEDFMAIPQVAAQTNKSEPWVEKSKDAIWGPLTSENIFANVILAGDSANQNLKPFVEGNIPVVVGGTLAGNIVLKMLKGLLYSHDEYVKEFNIRMMPYGELSKRLEETIETLFTTNNNESSPLVYIGLVLDLISPDDAIKLSKKSKTKVSQFLWSKLAK